MLLQKQANSAFKFLIYTGCVFKYIPFEWNSKHGCLQKPKFRTMVLFCIPWIYQTFYMIYEIVRFLQALKMDNVPPRIYIMNVIWIDAFFILFCSKCQLFIKRKDILYFGNILLDKRKQVEQREGQFNEHALENGKDLKSETASDKWAAIVIILGTVMCINNPIPHSLVVLDTPCAPHYPSSVIFPCKWVGDRPMSYIALIPFLLHDVWLVADLLTCIAFLWALMIFGFAWTQSILVKGRNITAAYTQLTDPNDKIVSSYRHAQLLTRLLNDIFRIYLQCSSVFPVVQAALLFFGTVRFTHLDLHVFLVFPACAFRCLFEALTQLQAAGELNQQSESYLEDLRTFLANDNGKLSSGKYLRKFRTSCWKLTVSAGALYTLGKTIVLVTLNHCVDLTFNLLVAYPKVEEDNWGQSEI